MTVCSTYINPTRLNISGRAHRTGVVPRERRPSHGMHRRLGVLTATPTRSNTKTSHTATAVSVWCYNMQITAKMNKCNSILTVLVHKGHFPAPWVVFSVAVLKVFFQNYSRFRPGVQNVQFCELQSRTLICWKS